MIRLIIKLNKLVLTLLAALLLAVSAFFIFSPSPRPSAYTSGAVAREETAVPIIMYHGLLKDPARVGKYVITPSQFESDLKYIQEHGFTTISMTQLIDYVDHGTPLPENPVILTFDDGYYNNYLYAYPLLQKYQMKAAISIIGKQTDDYSSRDENNAYYSHCTWDQLRDMSNSGLVEVQNHTYNLHTNTKGRNGCAKNAMESLEDYTAMLTGDVGKLQREIQEEIGVLPNTFTYPFGSFTKETRQIIRGMGFRATLSSESGVSRISRNPECLYMLKRFLRTSDHSAAEYLNTVKK